VTGAGTITGTSRWLNKGATNMVVESITGVETTPLYETDPMDVVVHKVRWKATHSTGQLTEFEHPRGDGRDFMNVDIHTTGEGGIETFSCQTGTMAVTFSGAFGSNVTVWVPVGMADELALAVLAEAAKYRAEAQA